MPQQITITGYKFSELSETAKQKILDKHRDINLEYNDEWYEPIVEGIVENIKEKLNLDIRYKDICFEIVSRTNRIYIESKKVISALSQKYPKLISFDLPEKFGLFCNYLGGGMCSGLNESDFNPEYCEFETEYQESNEIEADVENEVNKKIIKDIAKDLNELQNILREGYNSLYSYYNELQSDEAIVATVEANEYLFEENGKRI